MKRTVILLVILALLVGGLAGCKKTPTEVGTRGTIERSGVIDVNGDGIQSWNGGTIATYSDAGSTLTWSITGSTGDLVAGDQITFEGATADAYETIFAITDPTSSDKTITFPNSTGTVALNPYGESIEFEGATANAYETTLAVTDPTDDRTITLPDETGAVMMSSLVTNSTGITNSVTGGTNQLIFEGATADAYETVITVTDPTSSDKTITFPNASGVPLLADGVADAGSAWFLAGQDLKYEGTTANDYESILRGIADPGADAIVTFAAGQSGYMCLSPGDYDGANGFWGGNSSLVFEGATANEYELTVAASDPGSDATITLPAMTGTVLLGAASQKVIYGSNVVTGTLAVTHGLTTPLYAFCAMGTDPVDDQEDRCTVTISSSTVTVKVWKEASTPTAGDSGVTVYWQVVGTP